MTPAFVKLVMFCCFPGCNDSGIFPEQFFALPEPQFHQGFDFFDAFLEAGIGRKDGSDRVRQFFVPEHIPDPGLEFMEFKIAENAGSCRPGIGNVRLEQASRVSELVDVLAQFASHGRFEKTFDALFPADFRQYPRSQFR